MLDEISNLSVDDSLLTSHVFYPTGPPALAEGQEEEEREGLDS